ncbi:hypothetical protein CRS_03460 [Chryseobacterium sp. ON_d1]|nr:hypothetical protein CRS_03460 [Chryseobacterium sp. ON_d1]
MKNMTPRNNAAAGVMNPDSSENMLSFFCGFDSEIAIFERRNIVTADKKAISKKQNFQYSEYSLDTTQPKQVLITKIPIIKEASTLFIVFASDFSSEILFLIIPKTQILPIAKQAPMIANHNLKNQKTSTNGKRQEHNPTMTKAEISAFFVPVLLMKLTAKSEIKAIGRSLKDSKNPNSP